MFDEMFGKAPLVIEIKYHNDVDKIEKLEIGNWIDLKTSDDYMLFEGQQAKLELGVSMKLPVGYEAHVSPRSSTFEKFGILMCNSVGVIDNSYSGTNDIWKFSAYPTRTIFIPKNTRICQFRIMEIQPEVIFKEVDQLGADRGGFGTTGN